ncbi:PDZ domain-containing protein [Gordonia sp. HNM0687]|uniref:Zinc metalloprotease Rip1 n=1 Tax=Gordonia mangrovi TaxID=2665643 RepID=A0A6L7GVB0_9ACTN|nr:M50 family metallopeptidase [Gordonia mangrovi]MXP22468.1 PDZ domain-containing protein [Gordonia mangrovi]UVF77656.1 M50 family metallopeptidase [Gordonia mangrovi]
MSFALGVVLFAAALLLSVAWHECGHMWAAQATGMKVRRYFVGFGPTVWSTRKGETEYGLKALPLGGFCDIAGMTPYDEIADEDRPRAMYLQKPWKRLVVLFAGPAQNFILGFALVIVVGSIWGLPNISQDPVPATVSQVTCVPGQTTYSADAEPVSTPCSGTGPAGAAGMQPGDTIVAVNGQSVSDYSEVSTLITEASGPVALTVDRAGQRIDLTLTPQPSTVVINQTDGTTSTEQTRKVGITFSPPPAITQYDGLAIVPGAFVFTGDLFVATWDALLSLPSKVSALWTAVTGGERAADTPVSVYGASVMGGQAAERGAWSLFLMLLISINFFLGLFNLVPLLPLDGGHMAIVGYEKARNTVRGWFGRAAAGPVDYLKLMPVTYAVVVVMGGFMVLTLTADIINPIKIF